MFGGNGRYGRALVEVTLRYVSSMEPIIILGWAVDISCCKQVKNLLP